MDFDQLAKPIFRSRYAHTPFVTEQSEGPMDTVASKMDYPAHPFILSCNKLHCITVGTPWFKVDRTFGLIRNPLAK